MKTRRGRGRPRTTPVVTPLEHLEAFCCAQVARIERSLHLRDGRDFREEHLDRNHGEDINPYPRNDEFIRRTLETNARIGGNLQDLEDTHLEIHGNCSGAEGPYRDGQK